MNPKAMFALLRSLEKTLSAIDGIERASRGKPSWVVPTAAIACAGFMWWGWAGVSQSMSPTIYEIDIGDPTAPPPGDVDTLSAAASATSTASAAQPAGSPDIPNLALSFPGTQDSLAGRAEILIATSGTDPSRHPLNVGSTDFSYEFWVQFDSLQNTQAGSGCNGPFYSFTESDILFDNDRLQGSGAPANDAGYGIGIHTDGRARIMFSIRDDGGDSYSICSNGGHGDSQWHEVLIQWESSSGQMGIYVDGVREGYVASTSVTGDVSQELGDAYTIQNGKLVVGNEKHNIVTRTYTGLLDELRVSNILREPTFPASYAVRTAALPMDTATVALFHFDNTVEADSTENFNPIYDDPATWTNKLEVKTGVSFVASNAPTAALPAMIDNSDWGGAANWTDAGKWAEINTSTNLFVVDAPPDFPAAIDTVMEYSYTSGCDGATCGFENVRFYNGDPDLVPGECVTWRWFMEIGDVRTWDSSENHGLAWDAAPFGGNGGEPWLEYQPDGVTGYSLAYFGTGDVIKWDADEDGEPYDYDVPYMHVLQICYYSPTRAAWYPYVYTGNGETLLHGPSDFIQQFNWGDGVTPMTADMPSSLFGNMSADANHFIGWSSGMSGSAPGNGIMLRAGAVLAVRGRWPGSYLGYPISGEN